LGGSYSQPEDINDSGQVVGYSANATGAGRAFGWSRSDGIRDLGGLPGCCYTIAHGVNNRGEIVGMSAGQAIIWSNSGEISVITGGEAYDINEAGQAVGTTSESRAFRWSPDEGLRDLGTLPGGSWSTGYAINDNGYVVGRNQTLIDSSVYMDGFMWSPENGMVRLPPYTGNCCVVAEGINNTNEIVGISASRATRWTGVADAQPPLVSDVLAQPNPVLVGTPVTVTATISDAGLGSNPITAAEYRLDGNSAAPMTAQDGTFEEVEEAVVGTIPAFTVAGIHQLCVTGADAAGNLTTSHCIQLNVSDPAAGDANGTGRIDSPEGACRLETCTSRTSGPAQFRFAANLNADSPIPSGTTEFDLKAGSLSFRSTSYRSLVITGARAELLGFGRINGNGDYEFLLIALDGQIAGGGDRFRIKVWRQGAPDLVVYDNEIGTATGNYPSTILRAGSIVVHPSK
jgi:probable HAF family extracellular repeat protein